MPAKQSPIQIKISASLKAKFEQKCKENGKTITAVLKEFIESYNSSEQEQESKTQDTLADADLQQLKDEIYSLQCKVQSLEKKSENNKQNIRFNWKRILDLNGQKVSKEFVHEQLQKHHTGMMTATKQHIDDQVSELKQMLETSKTNTSLYAQGEDNENHHDYHDG
jgi:predicted AAA+ superfamily ATPase